MHSSGPPTSKLIAVVSSGEEQWGGRGKEGFLEFLIPLSKQLTFRVMKTCYLYDSCVSVCVWSHHETCRIPSA